MHPSRCIIVRYDVAQPEPGLYTASRGHGMLARGASVEAFLDAVVAYTQRVYPDWAATVVRITYRHVLRRLTPRAWPVFDILAMPWNHQLRAFTWLGDIDVRAGCVADLERGVWEVVHRQGLQPPAYGAIGLQYLEHRSLDGSLPYLAGVRTPPSIVQLWPHPRRGPAWNAVKAEFAECLAPATPLGAPSQGNDDNTPLTQEVDHGNRAADMQIVSHAAIMVDHLRRHAIRSASCTRCSGPRDDRVGLQPGRPVQRAVSELGLRGSGGGRAAQPGPEG